MKNRLNEVYYYLKGKNEITNQKDLADKMSYSRTSISKALNGYEDYLTDSFMKKLDASFPNTFNLDWLLKGKGKMLKEEVNESAISMTSEPKVDYGSAAIINLLKEQLSEKQEEINRLYREIGRLEAQINNKDADSLIVIKGGDNTNSKDKAKLTDKKKSPASKG